MVGVDFEADLHSLRLLSIAGKTSVNRSLIQIKKKNLGIDEMVL